MSGKSAKLSLPPSFTVKGVEDVKKRMDTLLQGSNSVYVDFERCANVDTAGLQLLVLFVQELKQKGREFSFSKTNTDVTKAIELGGFDKVFANS